MIPNPWKFFHNIQVDIYVPMSPKKKYRLKARVRSVKKAEPPSLIFDEEETAALLKMLAKPNPNAAKFREQAKKRFAGVDLTADEIPIE